ncbi:hypothetical protein GGS21DRAFT_210448 [Xylaria nigripes]|nr:hypothetical protein GGS21DRAFT_210448 [Xylaria nigripes]
MPPKRKPNHDNAVRAQAIAFKAQGYSVQQIFELTGIKSTTLYGLIKKAKERGWVEGQPVLVAHVEDKPRPGRPSLIVGENAERVIEIVSRNGAAKGYSGPDIARELARTPGEGSQASSSQVSVRTVERFLKRKGFRNVRRTAKTGPKERK